MRVENSKEPRTILLFAKFAKKGLLNVSLMAKTLLMRGLVSERVSKLSESASLSLEKNDSDTIYDGREYCEVCDRLIDPGDECYWSMHS